MAEIELIDREKQRQEKENTPEGRRNKKIRRCLGIAAAVIFFSIVYVINHNPNAKKDMVTITVQGVEIIPGKTKVQEILDGGFQLADQQVFNIIDLETKAEANSYYTMIQLVKEKKEYGTVTIANDSNIEQEIPKCTVLKITVYDVDECADEAEVDGIAMSELTYEELVSSYGEPLSKEESTYINGTEADWEKSGYYFKAHVGTDEKIHYVQSSYGRR